MFCVLCNVCYICVSYAMSGWCATVVCEPYEDRVCGMHVLCVFIVRDVYYEHVWYIRYACITLVTCGM